MNDHGWVTGCFEVGQSVTQVAKVKGMSKTVILWIRKKKTFQNENAESKHAIAMVRLMSIDISG